MIDGYYKSGVLVTMKKYIVVNHSNGQIDEFDFAVDAKAYLENISDGKSSASLFKRVASVVWDNDDD